MYRLLCYLALILLSPEALGALFEPPPTDKSVELLGEIFGTQIGDIYLGGAPNSALAELMEKFNFIIVVAGLIVVSYAGIMATINTAQEGTVMGKKWSAVWIPMRSIAGMVLMVPSPGTGYSMIQVTVMWIIIQGIGAADQLWTIILENMKAGVSVSTGTSTDNFNVGQNAAIAAKNIIMYQICVDYYNKMSEPASVLPPGNPTPDTNSVEYRIWSQQRFHQISASGPDFIAQNGSDVKRYKNNISNGAQYSPASSANAAITPFSAPMDTQPLATTTGETLFGISGNTSYADTCGKITIDARAYSGDWATAPADNPSSGDLLKASQDIYDVKQSVYSTMIGTINRPVEDMLDGSFNSDDFSASYNNARDAYSLVLNSLNVPLEQGDSKTNQLLDEGIARGWVTAGSFYFILNQTNTSKIFADASKADAFMPLEACIDTSQDPAIVNQEVCSDGQLAGLDSTDLKILADLFANAGEAVTAAEQNNALGAIAGHQGADEVNEMMAPISSANSQAMQLFIELLESGGEEPLVAHAQFGKTLMIISEAVWIATIIAMVLILPAAFLPLGLGTGAVAALQLLTAMMSIIMPVTAALWIFGATLAIYTPLIPFMIFTVATLGWLMVVIESIIAAPLIALGLVIPGGDEMGKLATALMLLANIFLRPMLMIFGFILAGRLYAAILLLVNEGISVVFSTVNVQTIFSTVMVMFVYITFVVSLTNTCFSLIYAVPDKVLRWLGGTGEQTDAGALQKSEQGFNKGAGDVGGGAQRGGQSAGKQVGGEKQADGTTTGIGVQAKDIAAKRAEARDAKKAGKQ